MSSSPTTPARGVARYGPGLAGVPVDPSCPHLCGIGTYPPFPFLVYSVLKDVCLMARAALHRQLREISNEIESLELAADDAGSVVAKTDDEPYDTASI